MPRHASGSRFAQWRRRLRPPRGSSRLRPRLLLVVVPVAVVAAFTVAWAVDAAAGGDVVRNVEIAGRDVGGLDRDELRAEVEAYADDLLATAVELRRPAGSLVTTAGELGLSVDVDATVERALDAGRGTAVLRPFRWLASFASPHEVEPVLRADVDTAYHTIIGLEGPDRVPPVEPSMAVEGGEVVLVESQPGEGIDVQDVADRLPAAALEGADPIVLDVVPVPLPPATTDDAVRAVVEEANAITDVPLTVEVVGSVVEVSREEQRGWLRLVGVDGSPGAEPSLALDEEAAIAELAERFPDLGEPPRDATVTLGDDGRPVVVPGQDGTGCCEPGSGERLMEAMRGGAGAVVLEATARPPERTTEEVESWGVTQPIGGSRAWPEGRSGEVGPGFTTFHQCCQSRVTNIQRMADLVRGVVVPPGGTFSINDHVGRRTRENGFVPAGAIRNGEHVDEVGGGVSQFATTLFNAAYFAGWDILDYQAHSEYFSRYPRGREATMGYPAPDLVIRNDTPFGALIWTSYTSTSLTITIYSSPFATAEQTGIRESRSGNCTVVVTDRTRTYPDGSTEVDEFRATYRPGEGQFC